MMKERRKHYVIPYIIIDGTPQIYDVMAFNNLDAIQKLAFDFLVNDDEGFDFDTLENKIYCCNLNDIYEILQDREIYVGEPYQIIVGGLE